jgi:hypothetical protein
VHFRVKLVAFSPSSMNLAYMFSVKARFARAQHHLAQAPAAEPHPYLPIPLSTGLAVLGLFLGALAGRSLGRFVPIEL